MPGQIFTESEKGIKNILREFMEEYKFTQKETYWEIIKSNKKIFHIIMHRRIALLLKDKYEQHTKNNTFELADMVNEKINIFIQAEGHESFFLLALLNEIRDDLHTQKAKEINRGKTSIQQALDEFLLEKDAPFIIYKIFYKKGNYYVSLRINGCKKVFTATTPKEMNKKIADDLDQIIREMYHMVMINKEIEKILKKSAATKLISRDDLRINMDDKGVLSLSMSIGKNSMLLQASSSIELCEKIRDGLPLLISLLR